MDPYIVVLLLSGRTHEPENSSSAKDPELYQYQLKARLKENQLAFRSATSSLLGGPDLV